VKLQVLFVVSTNAFDGQSPPSARQNGSSFQHFLTETPVSQAAPARKRRRRVPFAVRAILPSSVSQSPIESAFYEISDRLKPGVFRTYRNSV